jgi:putative intracellular protease/amidase
MVGLTKVRHDICSPRRGTHSFMYLSQAIPFLVESDIVALGGTYVHERAAWGEEVVVDRNGGILITGANPASASATGHAILAALKA